MMIETIERFRNNAGYFLTGTIILASMLMVLVATSISASYYQKKYTIRSYHTYLAKSVARSCVELATIRGRSMFFGAERFSALSQASANCSVTIDSGKTLSHVTVTVFDYDTKGIAKVSYPEKRLRSKPLKLFNPARDGEVFETTQDAPYYREIPYPKGQPDIRKILVSKGKPRQKVRVLAHESFIWHFGGGVSASTPYK